jgi:AcrR family transcriptional regulator
MSTNHWYEKGANKMASEESKKNRILDFSFQKFTTEGIAHVTMDDISRGVGIGKGTLYKFFPSKEILLFATIDFITSQVEKGITKIIENEKRNPIEKLELLIKLVGERLAKINPAAIGYIERSFPEAFQRILEARKHIIMKNIFTLFEEGKKAGYFEPDMDSYLVTHILVGAANHVTDSKVLSTLNYSLDNLFSNVTTTLLKGCLTKEGRKIAFQDKI